MKDRMHRTLVIYHYFEKDRTYIENFLHFLVFGYSRLLDYVIVIAGNHTISLPTLENVRYVFTQNLNNDFGGYSYAIKTIENLLLYDYFIFVNSSVRGPYTPAYSEKCWSLHFIEKLQEGVGLVGSTINILPADFSHSYSYRNKYGGQGPFSHVQTMSYAMPQASLLYLCESGFFDFDGVLKKSEVIRDYEIRLSQKIIANGWNLKCLLPEYNFIDYRYPHQDINPTSKNGDVNFANAYFGSTAHPFEIIFVKTNRKIYSMQYLNRLSYTAYMQLALISKLIDNSQIREFICNLEAKAMSNLSVSFDKPSRLKQFFRLEKF